MRKSRFTEEQIVGILQEFAAGAKSRSCIVHLVRHSLNFFSWKDRKAVATDESDGLPVAVGQTGPQSFAA